MEDHGGLPPGPVCEREREAWFLTRLPLPLWSCGWSDTSNTGLFVASVFQVRPPTSWGRRRRAGIGGNPFAPNPNERKRETEGMLGGNPWPLTLTKERGILGSFMVTVSAGVFFGSG